MDYAGTDGVYSRVDTRSYQSAYGQEQTIYWFPSGTRGGGTYRTTLNYNIDFTTDQYHTEWIDC